MPTYHAEEYKTYHIDFDSFYDQLNEIRTKVYSDCGKKKQWVDEMVVNIGDTYLSADLFDKFIGFMKYIGTDEIYIKSPDRAVLTFVGESKAIMMPRFPEDYKNNPDEYYIIKL